MSTSGGDAPRQAGGSLPVRPGLRPTTNSVLTGRGVGVGLPYEGQAPDLGAFEVS